MEKQTLKFPDGSVYVGELILGQPNGKGIYNFANGKVYDGDWFNGLPNGKGWMLLENGQQFIGHFVNGLRDGDGTIYDMNGKEVYKGYWRSDFLGSTATFLDEYIKEYMKLNGDIKDYKLFSEQHIKDVLHSYATFGLKKQEEEKHTIHYNNAVYYGDILGKLEHGYGMLIYNNGETYIGYFINGEMHGEGRYTWKDGSYYDGHWRCNCKHGKGKYYHAETGEIESNVWFGGERKKEPEVIIHEVIIHDNPQQDGYIEMRDENDHLYKGYIKNGRFEGFGTLYDDNGFYEGPFCGGKKHGDGHYTTYRGYDKFVYDQIWDNGELISECFDHDLTDIM